MAPYLLAQLAATASRLRAISPAGGGDRLVEPLQLVVDRVARDEPPRDAKSLVVHHQRFADGHARRNGNPLKSLHLIPWRRILRRIKSAERQRSRLSAAERRRTRLRETLTRRA